jgi:tetratricopeptide (TPR) repeat protein
LIEYLGPELAAEISGNMTRVQEILQTLKPGDFTPAVMQNLRRLHEHNRENFSKYFSLALALAVVFDQNPPPDWPHHQVSRESLPVDEQTLEQRFDFWVQSHENRKLYADPTRLGADQLKFVVDALVPQEELQFGQERLRFARASFDKAYSAIRYDHDRVKREQYDWPKGQPYSLEEIQKVGGICVDQAYFAMIAGKARGIPTLYFTGQGAAGGHAWFGFLRSDTQWNMDAGRYENQNYAVGAALDPQVWERITDHELKFLGQRLRLTPAFQAGMADLVVARQFLRQGDRESALAATTSALAGSPQNPDAWDLKFEILRDNGEPFAKVRKHLEDAVSNFNNEPDLRTHYQNHLLAAARGEGDEKLVSELERRMVGQNARRRSDLSVGAASDRITALLQEGKVDEALRDFRSQVNRLGRTGGGNFFYEVVSPIAKHLIEEGNPREAKRVLDQARRALRPERDSILDREIVELEALADPRQR